LQPKNPWLLQLSDANTPHFLRVIEPVSMAPIVANTAITTRIHLLPESPRRR
jgi:hypothetical protein